MNAWHTYMSRIASIGNIYFFMIITRLLKGIIAVDPEQQTGCFNQFFIRRKKSNEVRNLFASIFENYDPFDPNEYKIDFRKLLSWRFWFGKNQD